MEGWKSGGRGTITSVFCLTITLGVECLGAGVREYVLEVDGVVGTGVLTGVGGGNLGLATALAGMRCIDFLEVGTRDPEALLVTGPDGRGSASDSYNSLSLMSML